MTKQKLLGKTKNKIPKKPSREILDVFKNKSPDRDYSVKLYSSDFSSLCPITSQPDYAKLTIKYTPNKLCVETKSLKYYLTSFRNHQNFNEVVVNQIYDDLLAVCKPKKLTINCKYKPRGGISLNVKLKYPNTSSKD